MKELDELANIFSHFPGIGERQAKRFVYYLLKRDKAVLEELADRIVHIKESVQMCKRCQRYAELKAGTCEQCQNTLAAPLMMIVEKDSDLDTIRHSGVYDGSFFVLGGLVPILDKDPERRIRLSHLAKRITEEKDTLQEIILALSFTREGEYTEELVRDFIRKTFPGSAIKISTLGRGLSTGTELEYADAETLKGAISHRIA